MFSRCWDRVVCCCVGSPFAPRDCASSSCICGHGGFEVRHSAAKRSLTGSSPHLHTRIFTYKAQVSRSHPTAQGFSRISPGPLQDTCPFLLSLISALLFPLVFPLSAVLSPLFLLISLLYVLSPPPLSLPPLCAPNVSDLSSIPSLLSSTLVPCPLSSFLSPIFSLPLLSSKPVVIIRPWGQLRNKAANNV